MMGSSPRDPCQYTVDELEGFAPDSISLNKRFIEVKSFDLPIDIMHLFSSAAGHLTNASRYEHNTERRELP